MEEENPNSVGASVSTLPAPAEQLPNDETQNGEVVNSITKLVLTNGADKPNEDTPDNGMLALFYFGLGSFHPKALQHFASTKFFTFMLCIFGLLEGAIINGFEPLVLSSLERRYKFSSTAASLIIVAFDISVTVSVIVISYFGEKAHKPRWIGIALITQGIGAFIFIFPHFIFGDYDVGSVSNNTLFFESCNDPIMATPNCDDANVGAYILLLLGNVVIGIAAAPLFTIGVSFIDDIVFPKYVSLHIGAFQVSTIAGPAIGFGIGSAFLTLYVDVGESTNLTEGDPAWVGAWWLGFLLMAIVSILCAIPFFFFPRALSDTHLVAEARQKQMKGSYKTKFGEEKTFLQQLKAFPHHLIGLFKSKSWLFMTIAIAILFFSLEGIVAFAPKYVESAYRVAPSTAGLIIGAMGIAAGSIGTLTGALISHCVKIGKNIGIINWVTTLIAILPLFGFFLACPNIDVIGIGTPYTNSTLNSPMDVLLASCNADCNCSSTVFEPICGADGLTYFSPCRASCDKIGNDSNPIFQNCGCIAENLYHNMKTQVEDFTIGSLSINSTATRGICSTPCEFLPGFIIMVTIFIFLIFLIRVPFLIVTIRAVAEEQRSFSLGVQSVIFRVFGSIPGPLLFGVLIDSGCVYAQYECGRLANCWVYDNNLLSLRAFFFSIVGVSACVICTVLSWVFYPPVGFKCAPPDSCEAESSLPKQNGVVEESIEGAVEEALTVTNPSFNSASDD